MKVIYKLTEAEVRDAIAEYLDAKSADYNFEPEEIVFDVKQDEDGKVEVTVTASVDD